MDAGAIAAEQEAAGHQVYTEWIAPAGVVILAAFFFTVILIGFLKPRMLLPVLALWLVAGLFFGFFNSAAVAGLSLFNPIVSLEAPDAYAAEVAKHRTVVIPPEGDSEGSDTSVGDDPPAPNEGVADNESDELGEGVGGVGDIGQDAPGEVSEEALIARLNDARNPYDRADAAEALPEHGSDEALRALAHAALYDPSQIVRDAALDAIAVWDFETLVEILQEHPESNVRRAAAAALGRLQDLRAVEPLATALLTDEAAEVRQESAKALRRLGDTEAVSALIQSLREDAVGDVRAESAEALGVLEDERAIQPLLEALEEDSSALVREAAATALGRIRGSSPLAELYAARADDESEDVRSAARSALIRYTLDELTEALLTAASADDRATAAKILGERRNRRAIPALIEALSDPEEIVRDAAREALEQFGTLVPLENGSSVLYMHGSGSGGGGGIGLVPGTTARRAKDLPQPETALFVIEGAANTSFLRTTVGEIFDGADWYRQRSQTEFYASRESIDSDELAGAPFSHLGDTDTEELTMYPEEALGRFPIGVLPVPLFLESISTSGAFELIANTFVSYEDRRLLRTTSGVPQYTNQGLLEAEPIYDNVIAVPDAMPARVHELAQQITAGVDTPYEKAQAIQRYLIQNYEYALRSPTEADVPPGEDLVDWFLFESRAGTCGTFSSAFAVLARSVGLPARVVSGWSIIPTDDSQVVYANQAHQIAEILFEGYGWGAV